MGTQFSARSWNYHNHQFTVYCYLLQNIVKQSTAEADGYSDIVNALSTMTAIAHHINEMKRKHEHAVRVQEIQSLLLGWEVCSTQILHVMNRNLYKAGY